MRQNTKRQIDINAAIQLLELPMSTLQPLKNSLTNNNTADAIVRLNKLKDVVKKQRRKLAKKYHPDICKDDKKMKMINDIVDEILNSEIRILTPRPQPVTVYYTYTSYSGATTSSTYTYF